MGRQANPLLPAVRRALFAALLCLPAASEEPQEETSAVIYADGGELAAAANYAGAQLCEHSPGPVTWGHCVVTRKVAGTGLERDSDIFCCRSCDSFVLHSYPSEKCAAEGKGNSWMLSNQEMEPVDSEWLCTGDYNVSAFHVSSVFIAEAGCEHMQNSSTVKEADKPESVKATTAAVPLAQETTPAPAPVALVTAAPPVETSTTGAAPVQAEPPMASAAAQLSTKTDEAAGEALADATKTNATDPECALSMACDAEFCSARPNGWAGACGWHPLRCGGCNECQRSGCHSHAVCNNFCAQMEGGWAHACSVPSGDCAGCPACEQSAHEGGKCPNFCKEVTLGWAGACGWYSQQCGGCQACQVVSSSCEGEQVCAAFCQQLLSESSSAAAAELCGLPSGNCSGCAVCQSSGESKEGKFCANFCSAMEGGWGVACNNHQAWCGGCSPCEEEESTSAMDAIVKASVSITGCANYCTEIEGGWAAACSAGGPLCAGCAACQQSIVAQDAAPCAAFCGNVTGAWRGACGERQAECGGCKLCKESHAVLDESPCANFCSTLEHGWPEACGYHQNICGGCHHCKVNYRSGTKPCHQFCVSVPKGWPAACTLATGNCSGCSQCQGEVGLRNQPCAGFCSSLTWPDACTFNREACSGCTPCNPLALQAPRDKPCDSFCYEHPDGWQGSCSLYKERCGGCDSCQQVEGTPEPCGHFCGTGEQGWGGYCSWHSEECSGCNPCKAEESKEGGGTCAFFCEAEAHACEVHPSLCEGCSACRRGGKKR